MMAMMSLELDIAPPTKNESKIQFRSMGSNQKLNGFMGYGCYCWPTDEQFRDGTWHGQDTGFELKPYFLLDLLSSLGER